MNAITRFISLSVCISMLHVAFGNPFVDGVNEAQVITDNENVVSAQQSDAIRISGLTVERSESSWSLNDETVPELLEKSKATLRLFGNGLTKDTTIRFVQSTCEDAINQVEFRVVDYLVSEYSAVVDIVVPDASEVFYHICAKNENSSVVRQADKKWVVIKSVPAAMPFWLTIIIIVVCLVFSALFSGLNLGLMALDKTEIKILINTGNANEQRWAKIIQPVRNHGNFLLCSILLGNVLVNSTNAAMMGGMMSGPFAVAMSTILIVIFGEVSPQAICSRFGLPVGANTIYITYALMVITFPLAYPISVLLDCILGEEIGKSYNRERLKELVRLTTDDIDLDKDEVNIISGVLDMQKKTVAEVMTPIDEVFMLSYDAVLDFETISEIMKSGYSRIPVYEGQRHNVQKLLLIKDLALIDPDDNTPLRTLCEFYQNYCYFVFEDLTLAAVFRQFKTGQHGHMAFVRQIKNEEDPNMATVETIGLITLEDVIEELIQGEIMDETDIISDIQLKSKIKAPERIEQFAAFERQRIRLTPQLASASFQYLSTCVESFKPECISSTILNRLLKQDIVFQIKCKGKDKNDKSLVIFEQGKAVDYFVLILEGHVEVTVGIENLTFECGPFTFFGSDALAQNIGGVESKKSIRGSIQSLNLNAKLKHSFEPDYSVKAIKDVIYIAIKRSLYLAAVRATLMERLQNVDHKVDGHNEEQIDDDVKLFLNSLHDDYNAIRAADVANALKTRANAKSPSPNEVPIPVEDMGIRYEPENETVQMMLPPHI